MRLPPPLRFLFATFLFLVVPAIAGAQPAVDTTRLQSYFSESLKSARNADIYAPYIANERARIRGILEKDVNALIQPAQSEVEQGKAIDRQRQLVEDITGRLNESTVDLNLLSDEEKIYRSGGTAGSGVFMITKSEPELLARTVVLEENIDLLTSVLAAQQTRLQKLLLEQRTANTTIFLTFLWYLIAVLAVIWGEHFLRTQLISRIPPRRLRYGLAKIFTALVYITLFFWLFQRVYVEYPAFTTMFAVIGAAMIFMLQDVIKSFLGWLTYKGAFKLGDRVTLSGMTGDVLDIGLIHTTLLVARTEEMADQSQAGKIVRVPNVQLLTGNIINHHSTSDFENVEIPLFLADASQAEQAKEILGEMLAEEVSPYAEEARRQMDRRMRGFYFSQVAPAVRVFMEMTDKRELKLVLCFPAPIGQRRQIVTKILQDVLGNFAREGIGLAKPA